MNPVIELMYYQMNLYVCQTHAMNIDVLPRRSCWDLLGI